MGGGSNQLQCNPNLGLDWMELGWKLGWVVTMTATATTKDATEESSDTQDILEIESEGSVVSCM